MTKTLTTEQREAMRTFQSMMGKAKCLECNNGEARARGLCTACYQSARRAGELDMYPTTAMAKDPDQEARTMFRFFMANLMDIAPEFGYQIVPRDRGKSIGVKF